MEPTHPDKLVENATAPSAGDSSDPDGEAATFLDDLLPPPDCFLKEPVQLSGMTFRCVQCTQVWGA
jgi:hypothetical protein